MEHPWTQASKFRRNQLAGPCGAHIWAIKGPRFGFFYCIFASISLKCFKFLLSNHERLTDECLIMLQYWENDRAVFGPFKDQVFPSLTPKPARALQFWRLSQYGLRNTSLERLLFGTISGSYWGNVWPIFTFWPGRALKFWGLSQYCIKDISRKYTFFCSYQGHFWTMLGPCLS